MKRDKKIKVFVVLEICVLMVGFTGVILAGIHDAKYWEKTYRLDEQYIGSVQSGPDGGYDCVRCLIMDVHDEWYDVGGLQTVNHTFFFAGEYALREDLEEGELIEVRWKRVGGKSLIQGVRRAE